MASGGNRPGSGRKPSPSKRVTVCARVKPETAAGIAALRREYGVTLGALIDEAVHSELLRRDMLAFEQKYLERT